MELKEIRKIEYSVKDISELPKNVVIELRNLYRNGYIGRFTTKALMNLN